MPTVAVAGGSGHVGRTIVEVLGASKEHEVLVLGRSVPEKNKLDQAFVVVDYDDIEATAALLKTRGVHTIISAIVIIDLSSSSSQVNLVKAAAPSGTVRRFITSEWSVPHSEETKFFNLQKNLASSDTLIGSKFTVSYDALEKLQKGEVTELPSHRESYGFFPKAALQGFLSMLGRYVVEGRLDIPADKALNAKFTDIQTLKVKEAIELWRGH
ncbi:hypothetical protein FOMA001_g7369 [Fusarium oxysporum f. sp. matthiolae]|nr:hypothetical protein FOMA001_g7369 [Fusarium oxysporum f. sp. matthiolae]